MPSLQQNWRSMLHAWSATEMTFYVLCLVFNRIDVLCSVPHWQQNWCSMFFAWSSTDDVLCSLPGIQQNWHSIFCAWSSTELTLYVLCLVGNRIDVLCSMPGRQQNWCSIIIIKRISRLPLYCTRWEHRALYSNINHTHSHTHTWTHPHTHTHTHTHTHASDRGIGTAVKKTFFIFIFIEHVCLESGFKRGGRIRVAECLRQIAPNRWTSIRKGSFTKCLCLVLVGLVLILFLQLAWLFSCFIKMDLWSKAVTKLGHLVLLDRFDWLIDWSLL